jgi:hypothetical protein
MCIGAICHQICKSTSGGLAGGTLEAFMLVTSVYRPVDRRDRRPNLPLAPAPALAAGRLALGDAAIPEAVSTQHLQVARRPATTASAVAGKLMAMLEQAGEGGEVDTLHGPA